MSSQKLIQQGAEAKIFLVQSQKKVSPRSKKSLASKSSQRKIVAEPDLEQSISEAKPNVYIIKDRIPKSYRLKVLDERIRKRRTKSEAKLLEKINKIIPSPKVIKVEDSKIEIEFIDGKKLSQHLDEFSLEDQIKICNELGKEISKLHEANIIHGDLTTSNMILVDNLQSITTSPSEVSHHIKNSSVLTIKSREESKRMRDSERIDKRATASQSFKIFLIDFGLGFHSLRLEDKAVDLYLLKEALEAKHFENWKKLFESVLKGYKNKDVIERLKKVESRGRYKERY